MKTMMRLQVLPIRENRNDAFAKAPGDVVSILDGIGYKSIALDRAIPSNRWIAQLNWFAWAIKIVFLLSRMPRKSCLIFQLPSGMYDMKIHPLLKLARRLRDLRYVFFFHDLGEIQHKECKSLDTSTFSIVQMADAIIIHNSQMASWLEERGVARSKMIELKLFDYLHNCRIIQPADKNGAIIIAGRLSVKKCAYLKQIEELVGLQFNLYGLCDREILGAKNATYKGSFSPEELPGALEGSWGLVWDSQSIDSCNGPTGNYLRYNNPHKASLYLSSGLPLIVWRNSALSAFVREHRIGICVDSLREVSRAIEGLSAKDYAEMIANSRQLSENLRSGFYTRNAIETAERIVSGI